MTSNYARIQGLLKHRTVRQLMPKRIGPSKFTVGNILTTPILSTFPRDLPRFPGDTRFSLKPQTRLEVIAHTRGEYHDQNAQSDFRHTLFGQSHYELKVLDEGLFDNYRKVNLPPGSTIHIPVDEAGRRLSLA